MDVFGWDFFVLLKSFPLQILSVFRVLSLLKEPSQAESHCASCCGQGLLIWRRKPHQEEEKKEWGNECNSIYVILCWCGRVITAVSACPAVIMGWICLLKSEQVLSTRHCNIFPLFFLELVPETFHCSSSAVIRPAQQEAIIAYLVQSHAEYQHKMLSQPRNARTNHRICRAFCS